MPSSSWATPVFLRALRQNRTDILSIPRICTQPLYYESIYYCLYPQAESNRYQKLRRFLFFRLNYGNILICGPQESRSPLTGYSEKYRELVYVRIKTYQADSKKTAPALLWCGGILLMVEYATDMYYN